MKKFTHPGALILSGFGIMLLLMSFLVYKTMQQNLEYINDDFYTQEQKVNEKQLWIKNTQHIEYDIAVSQQGNELLIKIPENLSSAITEGSLQLYALAEKKNDTTFNLPANNTGKYSIDVTHIPKLSYIAKVKFTAHDSTFYKEESLKLYQP